MHIDVQGCASWNCNKTRPCGLGGTQRVVNQMEHPLDQPRIRSALEVLWLSTFHKQHDTRFQSMLYIWQSVKTQENGYALSIYVRVHPEGPARSSEACPNLNTESTHGCGWDLSAPQLGRRV